jgi:hypothetical protein
MPPLVALLVLSWGMLGPLQSASAQAGTCANRLSDGYRVGWTNANETTGTGLTTYIYTSSDQVCDSDHSTGNFNTAQIHQEDAGHDFASAGIIRSYGGSTYGFVNGEDATHGYNIIKTSSPLGPTGTKYRLDLLGSHSQSYVEPIFETSGGVPIKELPLAMTYGDLNLDDWFYAGATWQNSDVPGVPSAHLIMDAMGYYDNSTGYNVPYPCVLTGVNENSSHWTRSATGCDHIEMWTYNENY